MCEEVSVRLIYFCRGHSDVRFIFFRQSRKHCVQNDSCLRCSIARLPQVMINSELDNSPTVQEVGKAIKQMSTGKAPGPDAIPAEMYKTGGPFMLSKLTNLYQSMWSKAQLPQ